MENSVRTTYDPALRAHVATLTPPYARIKITVHINRFNHLWELDELFLYNFDIDSNCIEFAFGEKVEHIDEKMRLSYFTDPARDVPPFRIQISHQLDTVKLEDYAFSISYELQY